MLAVVFATSGDAGVLEVCEIPRPEPGPRDLLVRNFAAALNRADILQRRGLYPPPAGASPILGLEFAGEVAERGAEAEGFRRGDRVFGLVAGGAYAEFLTVDHELALPIPDNLSFDAAAAVPEAFFVAEEALFELGGLCDGDAVVVHAGASGVGSAALQLAARRGMTVIATAGSAVKVERCLALGATRAVNYREEDFRAAVMDATGGRGVDAIIDLVGAKHWANNLDCLRPRGRLVVIGLVGGRLVELDLSLLLRRRLCITGTNLRARSLAEKIDVTRRFRERVLPLIERGEVRPVIDRVYPLADVREAHARMEANLNVGKIVLRL